MNFLARPYVVPCPEPICGEMAAPTVFADHTTARFGESSCAHNRWINAVLRSTPESPFRLTETADGEIYSAEHGSRHSTGPSCPNCDGRWCTRIRRSSARPMVCPSPSTGPFSIR